MTDRKLTRLNALLRKRDDLNELQNLVGRQLKWNDEVAEVGDSQPTGESCRAFVNVALGNAGREVITDKTYRKMWLLVENDIDRAVREAIQAFEAA